MRSERSHLEELEERLQDIIRLAHGLKDDSPDEVTRFFSSGEAREGCRRAIEAIAILPRINAYPGSASLAGQLPATRRAEAESLREVVLGELAQVRQGGAARKVSVSMPEALTAAVQHRVGRGKFSQYVTEAVARQLELDLLADLSDLLTAEHGPVSEEYLAEAQAAWPDE